MMDDITVKMVEVMRYFEMPMFENWLVDFRCMTVEGMTNTVLVTVGTVDAERGIMVTFGRADLMYKGAMSLALLIVHSWTAYAMGSYRERENVSS